MARRHITIDDALDERVAELAQAHDWSYSELIELALSAVTKGVGTWTFTDINLGEGKRGKVIHYRHEGRNLVAVYGAIAGAGWQLVASTDIDDFATRYVVNGNEWAPLATAH